MSEWKERAIKRRDERHTALPEIRPPGGHSKKDTKKWCRGKVGREHKAECQNYPGLLGNHGWKILQCSVCGKHLDCYFPSMLWPEKYPKPAWVTDAVNSQGTVK